MSTLKLGHGRDGWPHGKRGTGLDDCGVKAFLGLGMVGWVIPRKEGQRGGGLRS